MPYLTIESFRFGLDARKSEWTQAPGALLTLENAHINPGGEIEKRKGFFRLANNFAGTFGIEVVDVGLVTFGSGAAPTLPPGVTYIKVTHPALLQGFSGAVFSATYHALVSIPFSVNFNGRPFIAATFADGNTFFYYDYTVLAGAYSMNAIAESYMGLVLVKAAGPTYTTPTDLAVQLTSLMNTYLTSYTIANSGGAAPIINVQSPADDTFVATVSLVNENVGYLTDATLGVGFEGSGAAAQSAFNIAALSYAAGNKWTITAPIKYDGTVTTVYLVGTAASGLDFGTSNIGNVVNGLVSTINAGTAVHQFSAFAAGGSTVYVNFPLVLGTTGNGKVLTVTYSGTATINTTLQAAALTVLGLQVNGVVTAGNSAVTTTKHGATGFGQNSGTMKTGSVGVSVSGGTPPYTYEWIYLSGNTKITISDTTSSTVYFSTPGVIVYQNQTAIFVCNVTDNKQLSVTSGQLTVKFVYTT